MRRARKRSVTAAAALAASLTASLAVSLAALPSALAFHAGAMFDKPPGAGGGGGIFYTGAPLEHGWNCTLCHENPPGKIKVRLAVEPSDLFTTFTLKPGQTYSFTATLEGESVGVSSPLSNFNTIAASFTDEKGFPAGSIGGFAAEDFYTGGPSTIVSAGQKVGVTSWAFQYTAPDAPAGPVTFHLAAVDGNGANSPPTKTLTDPFGDDVFVAAIQFQSGASALAPRRAPALAGAFAVRAFGAGAFGFVVAVGIAGASRRRRRGLNSGRAA